MRLALFVFFAFFVSLSVYAAGQKEPPVKIVSAYAFATSATQSTGVAFLKLEGLEETKDASVVRITDIYSDVAENIEMHTTKMDGGIMQMREVEFFEIKPGDEFIMAPKGDHVMLKGLLLQLKVGNKFPLTIQTTDSEGNPYQEIIANVSVVSPGSLPSNANDFNNPCAHMGTSC